MLTSLETSSGNFSQKKPSSLPSVTPANIHILGIPFHALTKDQALGKVGEFIQARSRSNQICFSNAYTVSLCWKDNELREVLNQADLVLADGMSIVWGGRWIGINLPCRVPGPDFSESLCADAEKKGYRIFFLGSTPSTLAALKNALLSKWPALRIVGMYSPPMSEKLGPEDNALIFKQLQATQPDILFVGMSTPKQEKWIASNLKDLHVPVSIGIGAAFDFMSGRIPRAPLFFQETGLEWLYRLYREPRRLWKRYLLGNGIFLTHLFWAWGRLKVRTFPKSNP